MKKPSIMENRVLFKNMSKKRLTRLLFFGLLSAMFFAGCAHKSVPPPDPSSTDSMSSEKAPLLLASAEKVPLNSDDGDDSLKDPAKNEFEQFGDEFSEDKVQMTDPIIGLNRAVFHFNDKLYFWLLKPVATGYKAVFPEPVRVSVKNFFYNLMFPVRFINCLFQGKLEGAGSELTRFVFNTIMGAGFFDLASTELNLNRAEEDFGQTLGAYGLGPGFYLNLPVLGPSSMRDSVGLVGDAFLDPVNYLVPRSKYNIPVKAYRGINQTSLTIGDYEDLKQSALDPYIAVRDAYFQYRQSKIKE